MQEFVGSGQSRRAPWMTSHMTCFLAQLCMQRRGCVWQCNRSRWMSVVVKICNTTPSRSFKFIKTYDAPLEVMTIIPKSRGHTPHLLADNARSPSHSGSNIDNHNYHSVDMCLWKMLWIWSNRLSMKEDWGSGSGLDACIGSALPKTHCEEIEYYCRHWYKHGDGQSQ